MTRRVTRSLSRTDLAVAALAGVAGVAGSYAVAGPSPRFVAGPVTDQVVALTPDSVVTFSILVLGDAGHLLGLALAVALTAATLAIAALAGVRLVQAVDSPVAGGAFGGLVAWLVAVLLTRAPVLALAAGVPVALVVAVGTTTTGPAPDPRDRREVLKLAAGVVAFAGLGAVVGSRGENELDTAPVAADVQTMLDDAEAKSFDVEGMDGLVTPNEEFYTVDIAAFPPELDPATWTLSVTGAVDEEFEMDYETLTSLPTETRYETLRCVGESLNGRKMDNAVWTGVPVMEVLDRAGVGLDDSCCVMLRAADDFFEEFPLGALRDAMLAIEMNGKPLPPGHGYPVRALVPGHWGEINVKWLTEIEVLETEQDGYWEQRGWHGTGPVNTVAKLHAVTDLDDGRVLVGGHAYAGTRGIERVEVSTDGGDTWTDAELTDPLPGLDVWRQWRHAFEPAGAHEVVVRATDGEGVLQPKEEADAFPNGPSGWVSRTVRR